MYNETKEDIKFGLLILALLVGAAVSILGASYWMTKTSCSSYGEMVQKETKFKFLPGCFVKTEKGWVNLDQYRIID